MKLVKTSVPQCACGNVPTGMGRQLFSQEGFCQQTSSCRTMKRQVSKEARRGGLESQQPSSSAKNQHRDYTPEQRARKQEKNRRRKARGKM